MPNTANHVKHQVKKIRQAEKKSGKEFSPRKVELLYYLANEQFEFVDQTKEKHIATAINHELDSLREIKGIEVGCSSILKEKGNEILGKNNYIDDSNTAGDLCTE